MPVYLIGPISMTVYQLFLIHPAEIRLPLLTVYTVDSRKSPPVIWPFKRIDKDNKEFLLIFYNI